MPACTACGNHLSTDYLRVFGDNDGALESCPNCAAGPDAAGSPATTGPTVGNGDDTSKPSETDGSTGPESPNPDRSTAARPPRADVSTDAESPDYEEPEFAAKTAGRSLEPPHERADTWGSRSKGSTSTRKPDRHRPSRDRARSPSVLSSFLDVFR